MKRLLLVFALVAMAALSGFVHVPVQDEPAIKLPSGFHFTIFADAIGNARHLAVAAKRVVYVKLRTGEDGNRIAMLEDHNNVEGADKQAALVHFLGTGLGVYRGYL